jgi:cytochrome c5
MRVAYRSIPFFIALSLSSLSHAAPLTLDARQTQLYTHNCTQCHARPHIGVPQMGVASDWTERNRQGLDALMHNVVHGLRGMPPLGYCSACSEADLRLMVQVMSGITSSSGAQK